MGGDPQLCQALRATKMREVLGKEGGKLKTQGKTWGALSKPAPASASQLIPHQQGGVIWRFLRGHRAQTLGTWPHCETLNKSLLCPGPQSPNLGSGADTGSVAVEEVLGKEWEGGSVPSASTLQFLLHLH